VLNNISNINYNENDFVTKVYEMISHLLILECCLISEKLFAPHFFVYFSLPHFEHNTQKIIKIAPEMLYPPALVHFSRRIFSARGKLSEFETSM